MTDVDKVKVLVTGATGMQGGAAVPELLRAGHDVTALVRDPSTAPVRALAEQGVFLATGNLEDVASLEAASAGHDVVFSVQLAGVDPADPGAEQRQARNVATAAKRAGVGQIIHTSVSGTGWRGEHPGYVLSDLYRAYWDEKEAAEDVVRQSGIERWTILKPAFYMENLLPGDRTRQFSELSEGRLVTATGPETVLALINADDFGAAVASAVGDPEKFHQAEIEFAGDALTYPQIADALSKVADREITYVNRAWEAPPELLGASQPVGQTWDDRVGYPARPHHAAEYGLRTTTFDEWAARQDWTLSSVDGEMAQ